ncbi:MAG TPA: glucosaminidase domain-containing protein [Mariprofundaceae bacterium]|nr:glucosaminidase domain-containing protein [Mariprofundaceae bacterium]
MIVTAFIALLLSACDQGDASLRSSSDLPDFSSFQDVKEKKLAFFNFLRPIVEAENERVRVQRKRMIDIRNRLDLGKAISDEDQIWLTQLAEEYNLDTASLDEEQLWKLLKRRVDTVPFRLALAQAANESSWGTSRFAREGINLFGQWCFTTGCGIVPSRRSEGKIHEVAKYDSVNESVAAYIRSINRVHMYTPLRILRRDIRKSGERPTAIELAQELSGYSERGEAYVKEIQDMIRMNYDLMSGEAPVR